MNNTGLFRVSKVKSNTKNGFRFKYQVTNELVKIDIRKVNLLDLKMEVENRGLLWGIVEIEKVICIANELGINPVDLEGEYGLKMKSENGFQNENENENGVGFENETEFQNEIEMKNLFQNETRNENENENQNELKMNSQNELETIQYDEIYNRINCIELLWEHFKELHQLKPIKNSWAKKDFKNGFITAQSYETEYNIFYVEKTWITEPYKKMIDISITKIRGE